MVEAIKNLKIQILSLAHIIYNPFDFLSFCDEGMANFTIENLSEIWFKFHSNQLMFDIPIFNLYLSTKTSTNLENKSVDERFKEVKAKHLKQKILFVV